MTDHSLLRGFSSLASRAGKLRSMIDRAEGKGIPADRQRIAWRIVEDFVGYGRQDVERGETDRARTTLAELEQIHNEAFEQVRALLEGGQSSPGYQRYVTSPILIQDGHFVSLKGYPDGQRRRGPVIFTGYGHFGQVKSDVARFADYGINIIQIELGPSSTVVEEGRIEEAGIRELMAVLDRAAENDVAVNLLISPHYFPRWALEKYPHLARCEGGFLKFCIDAPEAREVVERHIRAVIPMVKDAPALHSICLTNEPIYRTCLEDSYTRALWAKHLEEKFEGRFGEAKAVLGSDASSFADFPIPSWEEVLPTPLFYEWCTFNNERFAEWHRWMADIIHDEAPYLPVHAKIMPSFLWRKNVAHGVDPKLFCELSQINGNDCWCMYSHDEGPYAQDWVWQNMFYDMLRSFKKQPVFNSENHIIKDREKRYIPWNHVRSSLWQGAVHGQCATTIWVWERTYDAASDFAGSIMHRPLCIRAAGETSLDLMRHAEEVTALQNIRPRIGILYSIAAVVYDAEYMDELRSVYEGANFMGHKLGFVTGDTMDSAPPSLVVPGAAHVEQATARAISRYIDDGGEVILVGQDCLSKDEHDHDLEVELDGDSFIPHRMQPQDIRLGLQARIDVPAIKPTKGGKLAWGVEWLEAQIGDRRLLNAVNLLRTRQTVQWSDGNAEVEITNLLTGETHAGKLSMEPMEPILAEVRPI